MRAARHLGILFGITIAMGSHVIPAPAANPNALPDGPNRDLVYATCQTCHSLQYLTDSAGISRDSWNGILSAMVQYGLVITPENRARILDYLGTYLGPNPPPPPAKAAAAVPAKVDGKTLFDTNCAGCHQANGTGMAGSFPPLAGNPDLFSDRLFPAYVVLYGLNGSIEVDGRTYNGQMPAFGFLSDAQIAAVVNHVREAWGNDARRPSGMTPLDAATIKTARSHEMGPAAVNAYRAGKH